MSEKIAKNLENTKMRGTGRGTILRRSDASGTSRKKSEKSGNERKRKGNNFVAVGCIRNKSEKGLKNPKKKSGDERNMKENNFAAVGRIRNKSEKVGKFTKGEEQEGEQFCGGRTRPENSEKSEKVPNSTNCWVSVSKQQGARSILSRPDAPQKSRQNPKNQKKQK